MSWKSVLLVEEMGVPGENHTPAASHWQTLSHNVALSTPRHERDSLTMHYNIIILTLKTLLNRHENITVVTSN